jgi:uncharacterized protein (DUF488 family)
MQTIFTIGHSTRTIAEFTALLQQVAVDYLVDVRAFPQSYTNPQFNPDILKRALALARIDYCHIAPLGGPRHQRLDRTGHADDFWPDVSFQNYADYAQTPSFQAGLKDLREISLDHCCAIMRVEALWRRCHRRIIADYLLAENITVAHIMGLGEIDIATLTPGAQLAAGKVHYPATERAHRREGLL